MTDPVHPRLLRRLARIARSSKPQQATAAHCHRDGCAGGTGCVEQQRGKRLDVDRLRASVTDWIIERESKSVPDQSSKSVPDQSSKSVPD
jgi:hypothetical protein